MAEKTPIETPIRTRATLAMMTSCSVCPITRFRSGQIVRLAEEVVPNLCVTASFTQYP